MKQSMGMVTGNPKINIIELSYIKLYAVKQLFGVEKCLPPKRRGHSFGGGGVAPIHFFANKPDVSFF